MFRQILNLMKKEFLQLKRDKKLLRVVLTAPFMQLFLFGYAATLDIEHIKTAVYDMDKSKLSREFLDRFFKSRYFDLSLYCKSLDEVEKSIDRGTSKAGIVIPPNFSEKLKDNKEVKVQLLTDGTDSNLARIGLNYASVITRGFTFDIFFKNISDTLYIENNRVYYTLKKNEGKLIDLRLRLLFNPELRSRNFMIPGIIVMILLVITMILTSVSIVKEKELGTIEQLLLSPIKTSELIIGKLFPFAIIGFIEVILIIFFAMYWFDLPMRGSFVLLLSLSLVFLFNTLGLGILISTVSNTQQQAMMTAFMIMLPSIILSGLLFPIANMPVPIQYITYIIAPRYFLEIIRGIFLKGIGVSELLPQIGALMFLGLLTFALSIIIFKKKNT